MANTIVLKNYLKIFEEFEAHEGITPGMLLELNSDNEVQKHATSGGNVIPPIFALEDELQGKGIDDAYIAGDTVQCWIPQRGDEVLALLADGENVSIGEALESDGLGYLKAHTPESWSSADAQEANTVYSRPIVAIALEAQDLSGLEGSESSLATYTQRIKVKIV